MSRLAAALFLLSLPLAVLAADEPQERSIPYQKLREPIAAVTQADPQHVVTSWVRAEPTQDGQSLPPDLKIEMRLGATRQPVVIAADGHFELPMDAQWSSGEAMLWVNQPKSAVKIVESFTWRVPAATRLNYGQLMESLPVVERIQKQQVEIKGLTTTPPKGVAMAFAPGTPQTVMVGVGAKAQSWTTDDKGLVKVPFDAAQPANTPVLLSAAPNALQPYFE